MTPIRPMNAIEHGALKVLFQQGTQRAGESWVHGDREVERDHLSLLHLGSATSTERPCASCSVAA